ncbi:MAG: PKD domain-containing protein, partial [Gemmatimonadales bacterium]
MRSFHYLAFAAGIALATACGGDGGNGPANTAPTANFTATCTDLDCTFTDLSSDSDGSVDSYAWTFGNGGTSSQKNPAYSYT